MTVNNSRKTIAKIQRKTYLSTTFQEISIYFGIYEILITSGYIADTRENNVILPFLGTAIVDMKLREQSTEAIYLDTSNPMIINTERLLRQYMEMHSYKPWGFYSITAFIKGFTPIIPISYYSHVSQKNKEVNIHHFASKLLSIVSSNNIITQETMIELWLFMINMSLFKKIFKAGDSPVIDFKELNELLKKTSQHVYYTYLIDISSQIEEKVLQKNQFILNIYDLSTAKDITLKVGKNGLLGDIKKSNSALIKEMKKALN